MDYRGETHQGSSGNADTDRAASVDTESSEPFRRESTWEDPVHIHPDVGGYLQLMTGVHLHYAPMQNQRASQSGRSSSFDDSDNETRETSSRESTPAGAVRIDPITRAYIHEMTGTYPRSAFVEAIQNERSQTEWSPSPSFFSSSAGELDAENSTLSPSSVSESAIEGRHLPSPSIVDESDFEDRHSAVPLLVDESDLEDHRSSGSSANSGNLEADAHEEASRDSSFSSDEESEPYSQESAHEEIIDPITIRYLRRMTGSESYTLSQNEGLSQSERSSSLGNLDGGSEAYSRGQTPEGEVLIDPVTRKFIREMTGRALKFVSMQDERTMKSGLSSASSPAASHAGDSDVKDNRKRRMSSDDSRSSDDRERKRFRRTNSPLTAAETFNDKTGAPSGSGRDGVSPIPSKRLGRRDSSEVDTSIPTTFAGEQLVSRHNLSDEVAVLEVAGNPNNSKEEQLNVMRNDLKDSVRDRLDHVR